MRHQLALVTLEGRDGRADEEVGLGQSLLLAAAAQHFQPSVDRPQQRGQPHGVEIEGGLGQAAEASRGVIAGDARRLLNPSEA